MNQAQKARDFKAMHSGAGILVLPNAYDVASAALLVDVGFKAVATTSGGCAFSLGYPDGENIPRDDMCAAVKRMADAITVPLSADMEAGFGESASAVGDTVRATLEAGAVGINIEDSTKHGPRTLIDFALSVERIRSARAAADASGIDMVINARTDAFAVTGDDKDAAFGEAVRRANAYLDAGADCAFVISVRDSAAIGRLAEAINGPLNILAGPGSPNVSELEQLGVRRVTVGSSFAKAALTLVRKGAEEMMNSGTYEFAAGALGQPDIHRVLKGG